MSPEAACETLSTVARSRCSTGVAMLAIGVLLAYFLDAYLSNGALVLAHLLTMLGPTSIKIGYVLRLHALYRFNAST
ncbi:hypothetical protein M2318_004062 [Metapseudomonas resinovorans]